MRWLIAASLVAVSASAALALDCPPGAYAWPGPRGIEYCKRENYGPAEPAANADTCPAGTRLATNRWGEPVCPVAKSSSR